MTSPGDLHDSGLRANLRAKQMAKMNKLLHRVLSRFPVCVLKWQLCDSQIVQVLDKTDNLKAKLHCCMAVWTHDSLKLISSKNRMDLSFINFLYRKLNHSLMLNSDSTSSEALQPVKTMGLRFKVDNVAMLRAIQNYGCVDADGMPFDAFVHPDCSSESLPRAVEEYEDASHHVLYKTVAEIQESHSDNKTVSHGVTSFLYPFHKFSSCFPAFLNCPPFSAVSAVCPCLFQILLYAMFPSRFQYWSSPIALFWIKTFPDLANLSLLICSTYFAEFRFFITIRCTYLWQQFQHDIVTRRSVVA